jgi:hypothetical protein
VLEGYELALRSVEGPSDPSGPTATTD